MIKLAIAAMALVGVSLASHSLGVADGDTIEPSGILLGLFIALGAGKFGLAHRKICKKRGDRTAAQIFESGDLSGAALYLRPFEVDGRFEIDRGPELSFRVARDVQGGGDSLERILADAFAGTMLLVGVAGRGGSGFGVATAAMRDDWKSAIPRAIGTAAYILVIPSATPGTLWEVGEILRQRALRRTVFVMPPSVRPLQFVGNRSPELLWGLARDATLAEYGLRLPPYAREGALFRMTDALVIAASRPFDMRSPRSLAAAINRVI